MSGNAPSGWAVDEEGLMHVTGAVLCLLAACMLVLAVAAEQ